MIAQNFQQRKNKEIEYNERNTKTWFKLSINQSMEQPNNRSINKSINQSVNNESIDPPNFYQSINQSIEQTTVQLNEEVHHRSKTKYFFYLHLQTNFSFHAEKNSHFRASLHSELYFRRWKVVEYGLQDGIVPTPCRIVQWRFVRLQNIVKLFTAFNMVIEWFLFYQFSLQMRLSAVVQQQFHQVVRAVGMVSGDFAARWHDGRFRAIVDTALSFLLRKTTSDLYFFTSKI